MKAKLSLRFRLLFVALVISSLTAVMLGAVFAVPKHAYASGTTTVYLVKSKTNYETDGSKGMQKYTYNANGLVTSQKNTYISNGEKDTPIAFTYAYNGLELKNGVQKYGSSVIGRYTFKTNSKGWTEKCVWTSASITEKYKYNSKGQVTKYDNPNVNPMYFTYNSQGYVKKMVEDGITYKFKYDENGQITKRLRGKYIEYNYVNKYKSGRLMKQIAKDSNGNVSFRTVFKYKRFEVPKKAAKMIKAQQQAIIANLVPIASAHK